jgi:uncharacterized protein YcbK (DUF882 family)
MISMRELLTNCTIADVEHKHQINLEDLQRRINIVRTEYGKPMMVTSGYRTLQDHLRIYSEINARRRKKGLPAIRVPMGSRHMSGEAVDIADKDGKLMQWCKANEPILEKAELWMEEGTEGWCHFQIRPPRSGKRFFLP